MMNTKKILALVLALVMALSLFAGCNQNENKETKPYSDEIVASSGETIAATDLFKEHVTLRFCYPDTFGVADYEEWDRIVEAVNEITKEKINATIEFEMIPLGEYTDKMAAKYQANEPWDVAFSGAWNPFASNAGLGAYKELDMDFLNTYAPDAMQLINNTAFEACTVNGKIYGVPLQQIYVRTSAIRFDKDYVESLGFDYSNITKLEDLEPLMQLMKDDGMNVGFMTSDSNMYNLGSYFHFDFLAGWDIPGTIIDTDESCTVVNQFDTETFRNYCKLMKDWFDKGYHDESVIMGETGNTERYVDINPAWQPGQDAQQSATEGKTIHSIPIGSAVLTTSAINATTHVISSNCEYPGRAMAFINLLTCDAELLNLICHGEEGIDWEWVDEDKKLIEKLDSGYAGNYAFLVGNTFNEYYTDAAAAEEGTLQQIAQMNLNADGSPVLGFSFDASNVTNEIANCQAILPELLKPIMAGAVDDVDAAIDNMNAQLEAAGMNTILTEMQNQVDAWKAANG